MQIDLLLAEPQCDSAVAEPVAPHAQLLVEADSRADVGDRQNEVVKRHNPHLPIVPTAHRRSSAAEGPVARPALDLWRDRLVHTRKEDPLSTHRAIRGGSLDAPATCGSQDAPASVRFSLVRTVLRLLHSIPRHLVKVGGSRSPCPGFSPLDVDGNLRSAEQKR